MSTWIKDTLATGTVATTATNGALAILGKAENGNALGPINAVSHIVWGKEAAHADQLDVRHTVLGTVLNTVAVTGWAGVHELMMPRRRRPSAQRALLAGAAVSTLAYITDYHVLPKRLTPGFEERLSGKALFSVYAILAVAFAAGSLARDR